jgi:regulatory protein YycI of two-component signal transduction system YycFG
MKKLVLTISMVTVFLISTFAQAPQAFKYQAVVRNNAGEIINNQTVSFRLSIRAGSALGYIAYQETHSVTTNDFGLANLEVGNGTTSDDFSAIDWTSDPK